MAKPFGEQMFQKLVASGQLPRLSYSQAARLRTMNSPGDLKYFCEIHDGVEVPETATAEQLVEIWLALPQSPDDEYNFAAFASSPVESCLAAIVIAPFYVTGRIVADMLRMTRHTFCSEQFVILHTQTVRWLAIAPSIAAAFLSANLDSGWPLQLAIISGFSIGMLQSIRDRGIANTIAESVGVVGLLMLTVYSVEGSNSWLSALHLIPAAISIGTGFGMNKQRDDRNVG